MMGSILCLAFAGILAPSQSPAPDLGVGGLPEWVPLSSEAPALLLGRPTVTMRLRPKSDGKVTISAFSFDFDVFLRVEHEAGDMLEEDDDGGIETNSRLVVPLRADRDYRVLVASKSGEAGMFQISCQPGEEPVPSREVNLETAVLFHAGSASRALARGEPASAAAHAEDQGALLLELSRHEDAEEAWDSARVLWAEAGNKKREAAAMLELGRLATARKDAAVAEERFARALAAYRAIPNAAGEARALLAIGETRVVLGDFAAGATRFGESLAAAKGADDFECAALALDGLARARRASGDRRGEQAAVEELGDLWRDRRQLEKARASHERAREIALEIGDEAGVGSAWSDLGEDWHAAREETHARECFEKALGIARETRGKVAEAAALEGLGKIAFGAKDYRGALRFHEQQAEAAGEDPLQSCRASLLMGICHQALEDDVRARANLEAALLKARTAQLHLQEAEVLDRLSLIEQRAGRIEEGQELRKRSVELRSRSNEKLRLVFGEGEDLFHRGDLAQAQAAFEECLEEERSSRDPWCRMVTLLRLGECLEKRGRYAEAIRCSSEMLGLTRTLGCRFDEGEALERLGLQYRGVGALEGALEHLEEALSIARELGDPGQVLDALNGVGAVRFDLDQHEQALAAHREILELARAAGMPLVEAVAQNNIGLDYWDSGRYEESRQPLEAAIQQVRELRAPEYLAEFQGNLARTLRRLGEREVALELATKSLETLGAPEFGNPRKSLIPLEALAGLALDSGDVEDAGKFLARAAELLEEVRLDAQAAPDDVGVNPWLLCLPWDRFGQDSVRLLDLEGGLEPPDRFELLGEGFRLADRARARQLTGGIVEHRRGTRSKEAMAARARWKKSLADLQEVQRTMSSAIREGRDSEEVDRLRREAQARRKRADDLGLVLSQSSQRDAALDLPEGAGPRAVREAAVGKGCALVEFAEGDTDLFAYVLTDSKLALVDLGGRAAADEAVRRYLGFLTRKNPPGAAEIAQVGHELFQRLLAAPLAAAGAGIERLLIVPTPSLAVLPFDALVVESKAEVRGFGDLVFVIDRCEVDYSPSASILVELSSRGPRKRAGRMLVLADPVYPTESPLVEASAPRPGASHSLLAGRRRGLDEEEFRRLVQTREEAFAIAGELVGPTETEALARLSHLRTERSGSLHARELDLHLGAEANVAQLSGNLLPYEILHLAAHGWIDGQAPRRTGIALSWTGSGSYEGLFTIADASGLDLDANLVVLSACDTARGAILAGEGVESMACAFLRAGSRGVVASLWHVTDQVAAETMKSFYAGIWDTSAGKAPAESLHAAKLALRRGSGTRGLSIGQSAGGSEGHPSAWAPFIFIGPPR
ncbi:MAG: CHAT domain-containing protein [Planctomycetota bacterium]